MIRRSFSLIFIMLVLGLLIQSCGPRTPEAEEACGFSQNTFGERVSWKSSVPVTMYVHRSVPDHYMSAVQEAMDQWNHQAGRQLFRLGGKIDQNDNPGQDGVSVIYWRGEWEGARSAEQARTFMYISGNRIYESDILINNKNFDFYTQGPSYNAVHFQSLLIHELGHVLGLAHTEQSGSVMDRYLSRSTQRVQLAVADLVALDCEY